MARVQNTDREPGTFALKDCALLAIATGRKARTLKEFRDALADINPGSVYYHIWGNLLEARFEEREYNNDFAAWSRHGLHDSVLAERLAVIDPTEFKDLERLRQELLEIIEERMEESEHLPWVVATAQFEFIHSQIVVFDTRKRVRRPEELAELMPGLSATSVFYHFIDARRRLASGTDDFSLWLSSFGARYDRLCEALAGIDPYFGSLTELRTRLAAAFAAELGQEGRA